MMHGNGPAHNWGHAIAYHPALADMLGSVNAAILFQQISYWSERTSNPIGVYKSSEDLTAETGLSYREQATARKILVDSGFVVETNKRLEHRIYFRIEWAAFNAAFEGWAIENRPTLSHSGGAHIRNSRNAESAIGGVPKRRSSIDTEITAKTTTETPPVVPKGTPADDVKTKRKTKAKAQTLGEYIASIPEDQSVLTPEDTIYQDGIPDDLIWLAWQCFKEAYIKDSQGAKRTQADWLAKFRKAVRGNWYRLWYIDSQGQYQLRTEGKQAQARFGGAQ